MKMNTIGRSIAVLAGSLALALAAGAQGPGAPGGHGFNGSRPPMERVFGPMGMGRGWWNSPRAIERLKLTDDQRKAMDGILLEYKEKLIDLRGNLEKAELTMEPLMSADTPNDAAITAQIDKVVAARAELERANARFLLAIRDKLTPEQWKQVRTFGAAMVHHQEWHHDGERPGMHGRDGRPMPEHRQAPPPPSDVPGTGAAPGQGPGPAQQ